MRRRPVLWSKETGQRMEETHVEMFGNISLFKDKDTI